MFLHISATRTQCPYHLFLPAFTVVFLLSTLAACSSSPASHSSFPQNRFSLLAVPDPYVLPGQIIAGPDGNLWFPAIAYNNFTTTRPGGAIGRLTHGGRVTLFPLPIPHTYPTVITFTRDDTLWFLAFQGNGQLAPNVDIAPHFSRVVPKIGHMTPDGHFHFFSFPSNDMSPIAIATGSDDNLWLAENGNNGATSLHIARMTLNGAFTDFPLPALFQHDYLQHLIAGPDGNLWFSFESSDSHYNAIGNIGKISPQGKISIYSLGKYNVPEDMTVGPDHNIWFTSFAAIGRITPAGQISLFDPNLHKHLNMQIEVAGVTTGPDGNLWFATKNEAVGRLTPSGAFTFYPFPSNSYFDEGGTSLTLGQLKGIVTAPDGTLWLTDDGQFGHFS